MKILILGNFKLKPTNAKCIGEELAYKLTENGHNVITKSTQKTRLGLLLDLVITILFYQQNYDLVCLEVYSGLAFRWAQICGITVKLVRKPLVLVLHGGNLPTYSRHFPERVKRLLHSADVVTAPSEYLCQSLREFRRDIHLIPNPLPLNNYLFRERLILNSNIIWMRAFEGIYNPSLAPKVIAKLIGNVPDIQLTMIGPDQGDGSFQFTQQVAKELGVSDRIRFPGGVMKAEVPEWLNRGDIFINTTNIDNTPISVMEAMACGLCVVSTNAGGIAYLLKDGEDALLVSPNDSEAMANAVNRILSDPELAQHLSQNARRKAEKFDWAGILPQWETLFQEVLNA